MADPTVVQLSKTFKITPEKLLELIVEAKIQDKTIESSLTKDEKSTLTNHLRNKRGSGRKTLAGKAVVSDKEVSKKPSTGSVEVTTIKSKKTTEPDVPILQVSDEEASKLLETYQDVIKENKVAEQALSEQAKKRQISTDVNAQEILKKAQEIKDAAKTKEAKANVDADKKPDAVVKTTEPAPKRRVLTTPSILASKKINNNPAKKVVVIKHATPNDRQANAAAVTRNRYNPAGAGGGNRKLKKKDKTRLSQKLREDNSQQHGFVKPVEKIIHEVSVPEMVGIASLAQQMNVKAAEVLKQMMGMGVMATINDTIDQDTAMLVVEEMGHTPIAQGGNTVEDVILSELDDAIKGDVSPRPPVVAVMGHVDHGKTSLLDYIRKAKVAKGEAGGITQHIGAYQVSTDNGLITFLDTPGHSAFSQMRSRGAGSTDIVILVVAVDDGVMPETIDSIKHAKASGTTIIVAINKMDKEGANSERVKKMLSTHDVLAEDWGGDVMMVEVSAHTGQGIEALLDAITLQAEVMEYSAVIKARAKGLVLEARLEKGRGKVTTVLVQEGTLEKGDIIVAGQEYGKIKQIVNDTGKILKDAQPSMPVEVLGLSGVPDAGDVFVVVETERKAKEVADFRREQNKQQKLQKQQAMKMEDFMDQMKHANKQKLNILLKADVRGSTQALSKALEDLSTEELIINIVSSGVGGINDSDMQLAATSKALVLGFNVRADAVAKKTADREKLDVRYYSIIYNLIDEVKAMMSGLMAPELSEKIIGLALVKEVFKSKALGEIAGSIVTEGKMKISNPIRVLRNDVVVYEGELESLRRFKDEVKEVVSGTECGIGVKDYNDVQVGDQIEVFERIETPVQL